MAWDCGGEVLLSNVELSGTTLTFTIGELRFSAALPAQELDLVTGTVSCTLAPFAPDLQAEGTWRMSRLR
jgi:hypothetical protein